MGNAKRAADAAEAQRSAEGEAEQVRKAADEVENAKRGTKVFETKSVEEVEQIRREAERKSPEEAENMKKEAEAAETQRKAEEVKREAERKAAEEVKNTNRAAEAAEAQIDTKEETVLAKSESNRMPLEEAKDTMTASTEQALGSSNSTKEKEADPQMSALQLVEGSETEFESQRTNGSLDLVSSFKEPLLQVGSDHEQDRWSTDVNYDHEREKQVEDTEKNEQARRESERKAAED